MEHTEIVRRLRKLSQAITTHIKRPNNGGCAVVAGIVAGHLEKLGVMVEVVTPCGWGSQPAAKVRAAVSDTKDPYDWSNNGLSRTHLAVRFRSGKRTYTWDSDGLKYGAGTFGEDREYSTTAKFGDGLSVKECMAIASSRAGWNRSFDRKQIPLIKHLAQHHLQYGL